MIGNIFEWVADCYHPNYVGAPTDGSVWGRAELQAAAAQGRAPSTARPGSRGAAFSRGGLCRRNTGPWRPGIRVVRDLE